MKILSPTAAKRLRQDLAELEEFRLRAKEDRDKSRIKELEKELDDLYDEHAEELDEVNENHNKEVHRLAKTHAKAIDACDEKISDLTESNTKLTKKVGELKSDLHSIDQRERDLRKRTAEADFREETLDNKEVMISSREDLIGKVETAVVDAKAKAEERLETVRNEGYKAGYPDGLADGLRKVHELQSEDRDLIGRLATISIAQGNDTLKDQLGTIVQENLKDILTPKVKPSGKDGNKKS